MWKVTLKGLLAHRLRLLLTTLSVVLGVAFVAGTFVLTDTMSSVFEDLVRGGADEVDVLVRGERATHGSSIEDLGVSPPLLEEVLVDDILAVDEVRAAEGTIEGNALIVRPDGEPITPMGPPTLGGAWSETGGRTVRDGGRPPVGPDEVTIDAATADRNDLAVGDRVTMVFSYTPPRDFTVVGISTRESGENLAGATLAEFDVATAQEVLDLEGRLTGVSVWGVDGVSPDELVERLAAALPDGVEAVSSAQWADELMAEIDQALGFFTVMFGVFAAVALVVGAFIIANTFSITVVQRTREFALLRALGASRRQVMGSVVGEAVVVGLLASVLGTVAGFGLAYGLDALLEAFGVDMPSGTMVLRPRTVLVAFAVGLLVTVCASLFPARHAAGIHPMAALREATAHSYRPRPARLVVGVAAAGSAALLVGIGVVVRPDRAGAMIGVAAVLALVALALLGPSLTRPVLRLLGGSGRRLGIVGRIARTTSLRTPRRTWTTAAALTIGVALVSGVAVLAASMKASAIGALEDTIRAEAIVTASTAMTGGVVPRILAQELAGAPEVGAVSPIRVSSGAVDDAAATFVAVDVAQWDRVAATTFTAGAITDLGSPGTVAVDAELADELGYQVGDAVPVASPTTGAATLRLTAVYEPDQLLSGWLLSVEVHEQLFPRPLDVAVLVAGADGVAPDRVVAAVEQAAAAYPAVLVEDQTEYQASLAGQIDQLLALVTALLGMALFIAILGIMNTLALSIHERTREIGLLRAVGMTRGQVRSMIRWEAVTVAMLGSVVGLALGTVFGWATTRALADDGFSSFVLPVDQLAGAVLLAVLAGIVAALLPARSAARLDVLRAVTVE